MGFEYLNSLEKDLQNTPDEEGGKNSLEEFYERNRNYLFSRGEYNALNFISSVSKRCGLEEIARDSIYLANLIREQKEEDYNHLITLAVEWPLGGDLAADGARDLAKIYELGEDKVLAAGIAKFSSLMAILDNKADEASSRELNYYAEMALNCAKFYDLGEGAIKKARQYKFSREA